MDDVFDVVVLGSGLAGLTAGLFAARGGCSTVVLTGDALGGELLNVRAVEDFPGFRDGVSGYELCPTVQEQAEVAGASFVMGSAAEVEADGDRWTVVAGQERYLGRAVIVCTGEQFKALGVPGEERLSGRGVSHCASCDGPMLRGRPVAVVGGGDSGLKEALELAGQASEVTVFELGDRVRAQDVYRRRVAEEAGVQVVLTSQVEEILGDERVEALVVRRLGDGARERHEVAGVFVYVGLEPSAPRLPERLLRDGGGHLRTDGQLRTSLPGLLAAGGVRSGFPGQAVTAAGDGATAALAARRYLEDRSWP